MFNDVATKRFWGNVIILGPDDCWEWQGSLNANGYGNFYVKGLVKTAHRASLMMRLGRALPVGMCACHTCDNRKCVNPSHLWEGTQIENSLDREAKNRGCPPGEKHPNSRLSEQQIAQILSSTLPSRHLSKKIGVSDSYIRQIRRGLWRRSDVPEIPRIFASHPERRSENG